MVIPTEVKRRVWSKYLMNKTKVKSPQGRTVTVSLGYLVKKFGGVVVLKKKDGRRIAYI